MASPEIVNERTDHMDIWNRFQTTPHGATKDFKGKGGFSGKAINAMYIVKRLTEEFGPVGAGWRFVIDEEEVVEGHTLKSGDKAKLHKVRGHLEYAAVRCDNQEILWCKTSPQFGQTMLVDENKYGPFTDEEAPKKSATDCLGKCASQLGIGADIFLGMYDDVKYINQRKQEAAEVANDTALVNAAPTPAEHHPDPGYIPTKKDIIAQTLPVQSADDATIARQVFHLVKGVAEKAEAVVDIDDVLKHNGASLKILERSYPLNYETLKGIVKEARERLNKAAGLDDELPSFA